MDSNVSRTRAGVEFALTAAALVLSPAVVCWVRARGWVPVPSVSFSAIGFGYGALNAACLPALAIAWLVAMRTDARRHRYAARCASIAIVLPVWYFTWDYFISQETLAWSALALLYYVPGSFAVVALCLAAAWFAKFDGDAA
jgi:hypothetical protein